MPSATAIATCESCHAPIRWTTTAAERLMAVNPDPDPAGNQAVYTDEKGVTRSRALNSSTAPELRPHEWRARPHISTCTNPPPRAPRPRTPRLTSRPLRRAAWRQR